MTNVKTHLLTINRKQNLTEYIAGLTSNEQAVTGADIPVLATLENTRFMVLSNGGPGGLSTVTVIKPNTNILGNYPKEIPKEKPREVILCLEENIFARLELAGEESCPKPNKDEVEKKINNNEYRKGGGARNKGMEYQVSLLAMVILNATKNAFSEWKLSTENEEADKFDDIVLEWSEGAVLIQSKHRYNEKKITFEELTSTHSKNNDFSLPKYFLSYMSIKKKFNIKNLIICTNAGVHEKALEFLEQRTANTKNLLYYENGECSFYTLNHNILPELIKKTFLYYDYNFKNKDIQKSVIADENFTDFLNKLQLFINYPPLNDLHKIAEKLLAFTERWSNRLCKITPSKMYSIVKDWFQQDEGVYYTEIHVKAMFAETWTEKYCEKLKHYKLSLQKNDLNFQDTKQIFYVTSSCSNLLQAIKVYYAVQNQKEKNKKILVINPDDDIDSQKLILDAFALPRYAFLIIIQLKINKEFVIMEMCNKLRDILHVKTYKKVILITKDNDVFARCIGHSENDYETINGSVTFEDLSKDSQEKLLKNERVVFQGKSVRLEELLSGRANKDYAKAIDSEILENIITGEVKVGVKLLDMDKNITPFYIKRTFKRSVDNILEDNIHEVNENVVLISDSAGGGKSTVLSKLATDIKERYPHLWVIKIALTEYTRFFRENIGRSISAMGLLNSKEETKLTNRLETFVFSINKKVVLMLDGIDEISPDYTELIFNLLNKCLQAANFAKLFVTARPHMVQGLEKILKVKPFELQPFTVQNQVDFLTGYWEHDLDIAPENKSRCEQYATALIDRMSSWTKGHNCSENEFTAIALQLRMLAEIFKETIKPNKSSHWEGCKEHLESTKLWPALPEKIEIKKLYDMFIETKRHIYVHKGNADGNSEANTALNTIFDESLAYHKTHALRVILNEEDRRLFSCYQESSKVINESILKIGIVQRFNGGVDFIHRTFAEFFVAESLVSELQLQSQNPSINFQQFFIDRVLRLPEYRIIRAFLDNFLHKVELPIPSNIFKSYQSRSNCILLLGDDYWIIHLIAKEGCVAILQLILNCVNYQIIKDDYFAGFLTDIFFTKKYLPSKLENVIRRENMSVNTLNAVKVLLQDMGLDVRNTEGQTPLLAAVINGHLEMVDYLVHQGAKVDSIDKYELTALHLAAGKGHVDIVKYLLELDVEIDCRNDKGYTPLHFAAAGGDLDCVKCLIKSNADVTITNKHGRAALHFAAMGGQFGTIKFLNEMDEHYYGRNKNVSTPLHVTARTGQLAVIEFLAKLSDDVNVKDKSGCTPLHFAARDSHLDIVKFLHELGGDLTIGNNRGKTPLHLAADEGQLDSVKYLLSSSENSKVDVKDNDGCTPLHLAVWNGHFKTVKFLHERGASCNIRDHRGKTALHLAAENRYLDKLKYLIKFKDDINIKDNDGCTAFHYAARRCHLDTVKFLHELGGDLLVNVKNDHGETAMHLAAGNGNLKIVKYLINLNDDINIKNNAGCTALHYAVTKCHLGTVKFLHEVGAYLNIQNGEGKTALHLAAANDNYSILKYLVDSKRDIINIKDNDDCTALHYVVTKCHLHTVKAVKLLHTLGADLNIKNICGKTALHLAAEDGHLYIVKCLHELRADFSARDNQGNLALHLAAEKGRLGTLKFLLQENKDLNVKNSDDKGPLHLAAENGHSDTLKFLLTCRTDLNKRDNCGRTALHSAAASGHLDVVKYLLEADADITIKDKNYRTPIQLADFKGHSQIVHYFKTRNGKQM